MPIALLSISARKVVRRDVSAEYHWANCSSNPLSSSGRPACSSDHCRRSCASAEMSRSSVCRMETARVTVIEQPRLGRGFYSEQSSEVAHGFAHCLLKCRRLESGPLPSPDHDPTYVLSPELGKH